MADSLTREDPTYVINHDILMLYNSCNRIVRELYHSQSSGISGMLEHDQRRMQEYIAALNSLKAWVVGQPQLDLPETHPRPYTLEAAPEVPDVESESVAMFINLVTALRTELIHSQSARLPSGMLKHDAMRFDLITTKMSAFLSDYIVGSTPLDLPESSPDEAMTGHGKGGV